MAVSLREFSNRALFYHQGILSVEMIGLGQDPDVDHGPAAIALCHRHGGKQRGDETHTLGVRLDRFSLWSGVISIYSITP